MRVIIIAVALLAAVTISTLQAVADPTFRPTMVEAGVAPEGHVVFPIAFPKAPIVSVALSQARFVAATGCKPLALNVTGEGRACQQRGMAAYSQLQQREFDAEPRGFTAIRHQSRSWDGLF